MKFYRGLVDIAKLPARNQIQRGFVPMAFNVERKQVQVANARPANPMSAAEVVVLRHMHGQDSVTELVEIGEKKQLSFAAERDRLEQEYGEPRIAAVFGPRGAGTRLPREVEDIATAEPEGEPIVAKSSGFFPAGENVELDAPEQAAA